MHVRRRHLSSIAARASSETDLRDLSQCAMLPRIKYLEVSSILAQQKEASSGFCRQVVREVKCDGIDRSLSRLGSQVILAKIRLLSQSHVVHPGLKFFATNPSGTKIDPADVPGLKESGWTPELDALCVLRVSRQSSSPDLRHSDS
jgi:histone acetyltransferase